MFLKEETFPAEAVSRQSPGSGLLEFEKVAARTVVRAAYATSPLRLLTPRNRGRAAWVYTSSYGGGIVGGDALKLRIQVRRDAEAVLLSQASTKVYRSALSSSQSIEAVLETSSMLLSLMDPVVCFEGSSFSQRQSYDLQNSASLLVVDTVSCGRHASGERWAFNRFSNRIEVRREGRPVLLESVALNPESGAIPDRMGRFNAFSAVALIGPEFMAQGREIVASLSDLPIARRSDLLVAASALEGEGAILRVAGVSIEEVEKTIRCFLQFVPERLGDNPWTRKW